MDTAGRVWEIMASPTPVKGRNILLQIQTKTLNRIIESIHTLEDIPSNFFLHRHQKRKSITAQRCGPLSHLTTSFYVRQYHLIINRKGRGFTERDARGCSCDNRTATSRGIATSSRENHNPPLHHKKARRIFKSVQRRFERF